MSLRPTLDFLLYDWLKAQELTARERFADHSRETFDAVFDTCERIAREKYAPHRRPPSTAVSTAAASIDPRQTAP